LDTPINLIIAFPIDPGLEVAAGKRVSLTGRGQYAISCRSDLQIAITIAVMILYHPVVSLNIV